MDLGQFTLCLNVKDLQESLDFYQNLGFEMLIDQQEENWAVVKHNNLILSLYQGHIKHNLLNFRGADIEAAAVELTKKGLEFRKPAAREPDGSWGSELIDPDGNRLYFNTFPEERDQYLRTGDVFE